MIRRNYQKELEALINGLNGRRPTLLLHSCCAPCSSYCLRYLSGYFDITDMYYNPNITDREEYDKRSLELQRLIGIYNSERAREYGGASLPEELSIKYIEGEYEPGLFFSLVKGLEDVPEGGKRCYICYELRLRKAALTAREKGLEYFTTTLSISPLKNAVWINEIGERLSEEIGVKHLPSDFKKRDGFKISTELSARYGLYRQDYCGCVFSRRQENQLK
ncbi:MAG TPA: hypothetical protein DCL38_03440 [Lachnospiraceae bacterium]|nr:hypothetical protein [Lachnospiraceae bacterium]